MNNSDKTAITRRSLSLPMQWLEKRNMLGCNRPNRRLDYGCGKGFDADTLGFQKYDLNHFPKMPEGTFDIITCNYVLNVIESREERHAVVDDILFRLADCGTAYIAVRNDLDTDEEGYTTKRGTWQGHVGVPRPFYMIRKCAGYRLYSWTNL